MQQRSGLNRIFTVPNILSVFRLTLIPPIVILYAVKKNYTAAIILIIVSGLSDVLDGIIARKCNQITNVGKILDPIADKLTQGALIVCLALRYSYLWAVVALFAVKEVAVGVLGLLVIKKDDNVTGSQWYGKACTVAMLTVLGVLILFPYLPEAAVFALICVCVALMLFSFIMYANFFIKILKSNNKK